MEGNYNMTNAQNNAAVTPVANYRWTKADDTALTTILKSIRENKNTLRDDMVTGSFESLRHFHNCGNPVKIQEFYDILNEDGNLFRKAAFVKWVKEFSNAAFSDGSKKFSKNVNLNSVKKNYQEDQEIGSELLAKARLLPFYKFEMAEEKTEATVYDRLYDRADKSITLIDKSIKDGKITLDATMARVHALEQEIVMVLKPLTTAEVKKNTPVVTEKAVAA